MTVTPSPDVAVEEVERQAEREDDLDPLLPEWARAAMWAVSTVVLVLLMAFVIPARLATAYADDLGDELRLRLSEATSDGTGLGADRTTLEGVLVIDGQEPTFVRNAPAGNGVQALYDVEFWREERCVVGTTSAERVDVQVTGEACVNVPAS